MYISTQHERNITPTAIRTSLLSTEDSIKASNKQAYSSTTVFCSVALVKYLSYNVRRHTRGKSLMVS